MPARAKPSKPAARRRGRPTAGESQQKLATVLRVATQLFARVGYRGVTMRGVADAAGVSTRTLYNSYADKLALFAACLEAGSTGAPMPAFGPATEPRDALRHFAVALVQRLALESSVGLGMLVYREGPQFPELLAAADANQDTWLVQPLARYLRLHGLERERSCERAKLFIALAISEHQRRIAFGRNLQTPREIEQHARLATAVFIDGAAIGAGDRLT